LDIAGTVPLESVLSISWNNALLEFSECAFVFQVYLPFVPNALHGGKPLLPKTRGKLACRQNFIVVVFRVTLSHRRGDGAISLRGCDTQKQQTHEEVHGVALNTIYTDIIVYEKPL
jgi:hypothetical protein